MTKNRFFLTILAMVATVLSVFATPNEIVVHTGGAGNGYDQIYIEPPYVTYDDDLNELYVYFATTGTIDLEYDDGTGARLEALKLEGNSLPSLAQRWK